MPTHEPTRRRSQPAAPRSAAERTSARKPTSAGGQFSPNCGDRLTQLAALANQSTRIAVVSPAMIPATALQSAVAQLTSLDGRLVQEDKPYENQNQAAILVHMAGEWGIGNNQAVTGGHLLTAMEAKWGPAVTSAHPNNLSPEGVHFLGGLPGNNITNHQHRFRLVHDDAAGQRRVSPEKSSTFWPRSWTEDDLIRTLNNSFQNGPADTWASKANMTYWYRWQTLGANTVFPLERVAAPTGTQRNKMKAGRQQAAAI